MIPVTAPAIPAMTPDSIQKVRELERHMLALDQVEIQTEHVLHAGMYARTITIPAGVLLTGVLVKVPTALVVSGCVTVWVGDRAIDLDGYRVIAASAGRKQVFLAHSETRVTMLFPTNATTVEQAENEFTDEADILLSRSQSCQTATITGEHKCLEQ